MEPSNAHKAAATYEGVGSILIGFMLEYQKENINIAVPLLLILIS